MTLNTENIHFVARGFIKQVHETRVVIVYRDVYENIPRKHILGNTWFDGWHGSIVENENKEVFFIPD